MLKIALFGTSADPPTEAHQLIIKWCAEHFDQVAIWASNNPFKTHAIPLEKRLKMLEILVTELHQEKIAVYPELSSHRAIETLEKAQLFWKNSQFTFIIGADLVSQLSQWYRIEKFLQDVELLVIPRPGYPLEKNDIKKIEERGGKLKIAPLMGLDISSTIYREKGDDSTLTPAIQAYIHQEQLYRWSPKKKRMEIYN